jgi:DNA invertase Pin-like site-specific DNA recombinase/biotin operon repressor
VSDKITLAHRRRLAYVYVRQSSAAQVRVNTESLERQYELTRRAVELGWEPTRIVVVDEDLGRSGAESTAREGFKALVAAVGLSQVGLVLGIEVSRLARNNADWYQLLDLCSLTDTLIADADGVYHPADYNDRLVLGLKGTMSEAELHLLRGRLLAGVRHKAAKGELRVVLPVGYEYDADDRVVLCADEAAREAVATVFRRFDELGSARQVVLSLRQDGLDLPRHRPRGRVEWGPATQGFIHKMLINPCYAGAFVFGRSRTIRQLGPDGSIKRRLRYLPPEEWSVVIPDHHPGYISWETYQAIRARLRANCSVPRGEGGGAVREGSALLQGILRCGRCGRMMRVGYSGAKSPPGSASPGQSSRYECTTAEPFLGPGRQCQGVGGRQIEHAVMAEVFAALEPAALAATVKALAEAESTRSDRLRLFEATVERTRYEAERARRQHDACEPENRQVARSLEAAWEQRLAAVTDAEAALAAEQARHPSPLTAEELAWLERAGADLRAVFDAPTTTVRERKQLLRAMVAEVAVTVNRESRRAELRLCWEGGAITTITVDLPRLGAPWRATAVDTVELVRRLAAHYDDATIAAILARQHRRTGTRLTFTKARVAELRKTHRIRAHRQAVTPSEDDGEVVGVVKAARELGVGVGTIYRWLADGFIAGKQLTPGAPWRIRLDDELLSKVTEHAPDGWLPLDQAAEELGVARQTVLHKVQRGELNAVQVTKGRRKGLRIQVSREGARLFDQ